MSTHTPRAVVRFVYDNGVMTAYVVGPRGGLREVDYHEAWLAIATGEATEEMTGEQAYQTSIGAVPSDVEGESK